MNRLEGIDQYIRRAPVEEDLVRPDDAEAPVSREGVAELVNRFREIEKEQGPRDLRGQLGKARGRLTLDELKEYTDRAIAGRFSVYRPMMDIMGAEKGSKIIIVAGGASLHETLPRIKKLRRLSKRTKIMTVNKSYDFMASKGVVADYHAMCDPGDWVADYTTPKKGTKYLLAAQLHEKTLERFLPFKDNVFMWHGDAKYENGTIREYINKTYPTRPQMVISGAGGTSTIGMMSIYLACLLGCSEAELHGFDSCFLPEADNLHAYSKPRPSKVVGDNTVASISTGHKFRFASDPNMSRQAMEFGDLMVNLQDARINGQRWPMTIKVAGRGVIPWLTWKDGNDIVQCLDPSVFEQYAGQTEVDFRPEWAKELLAELEAKSLTA